MARTGLSRPSFYVYFRDRNHIAIRLVEEIGSAPFSGADAWFGGTGEDPAAETLAGVRGVADVYVEHGEVLRAIQHAATQDEEVADIYIEGLIGGFIDAVEAQIGIEIERGKRCSGRGSAAHGRGGGVDARADAGRVVRRGARRRARARHPRARRSAAADGVRPDELARAGQRFGPMCSSSKATSALRET